MNAIATQSMPALGAQISAMVGYADVCNRQNASAGEIASAWGQAHDKVFVHFGIEAKGPSEQRMDALAKLANIVPQVRESFDDRVAKLFKETMDRDVISAQEISAVKVKEAMDLNLISELPANALIQSALHAYPTMISRIFRQLATFVPGSFIMAFGFEKAYRPEVDVLSIPVLFPVIFGFATTVILWIFGTTSPSISKRFNELTKGEKS